MTAEVERTGDGRHVVVDGRRWRATDPGIPEPLRQELVDRRAGHPEGTRCRPGDREGTGAHRTRAQVAERLTGLVSSLRRVIRPVRPGDIPAVLSLIRELADFEFEPEAVAAGEDDLRGALFADAPIVFGHVAVEGADVVGVAVWHLTFSTWTGRPGVHLTDLIVAGRARADGHGQALFDELVRICRERGYARLDWEVCDALVDSPDRREPHGFYARQGAAPRPGWTAWRMDAAALAAH